MNINPLDIGEKVAGTIIGSVEKNPSYTTDLALEGLLYLYDASKKKKYLEHVLEVWKFREKNQSDKLNISILFTCLHFETYLRTGDKRFISSFLDDARELMNMPGRDEDGAVCYPVQPETKRISVDMMHGYAVFMARAGWLSGDQSFFAECANQYQLFRNILRNPETGLWHQGRNWSSVPGSLSPGHWNRVQGWVLRGMVDSLDYLPKDTVYYDLMMDLLNEFVEDLIRYQDARGMWHQLTDRQDAWPETSGTAMLIHYLYKAFHRGWLSRDPYLYVAEKALNALFGYIRKDGTIMNTSMGTGPLSSIEGYLYRPAVPGDPHAAGPVLMACSGPYMARLPIDMI